MTSTCWRPTSSVMGVCVRVCQAEGVSLLFLSVRAERSKTEAGKEERGAVIYVEFSSRNVGDI